MFSLTKTFTLTSLSFSFTPLTPTPKTPTHTQEKQTLTFRVIPWPDPPLNLQPFRISSSPNLLYHPRPTPYSSNLESITSLLGHTPSLVLDSLSDAPQPPHFILSCQDKHNYHPYFPNPTIMPPLKLATINTKTNQHPSQLHPFLFAANNSSDWWKQVKRKIETESLNKNLKQI